MKFRRKKPAPTYEPKPFLVTGAVETVTEYWAGRAQGRVQESAWFATVSWQGHVVWTSSIPWPDRLRALEYAEETLYSWFVHVNGGWGVDTEWRFSKVLDNGVPFAANGATND